MNRALLPKVLLVAGVTLLLMGALLATPALAQGVGPEVRVFVDKKRVDFPDIKPFINADDRTMVPVRFVSSELGAQVDWDGETQTVTMRREDKIIVLGIGNDFAHVNGERKEFGSSAQLVGDRTMVPLRFISETFGASVDWVGTSKTVYITTGTQAAPPPVEMVTLNLYFADKQAQYLLPETRVVPRTRPSLAELIFEQLVEGPAQAGRKRTLPLSTRHRGLNVDGGVAYVNLTSDFLKDFSGGSAAERMFFYSIVNSLAELQEIERVQFLLEGSIQEAMLGHEDTSRPLSPRPDLVKMEREEAEVD